MIGRLLKSIAVLFLAQCLPAVAFAAETWPEFRGPGAQGHATATQLPLTWNEQENIVWKVPVPGRGWSSPVIVGDRIWMTTAIERPLSAEEAKNRLSGAPGPPGGLTAAGPVSLRLLALDRATGKQLYDVELFRTDAPDPLHKQNSYASPTPVYDDGKLYCHFGTYGTACVEAATGRVLWSRQFRINHIVGPGSSPVLHGDLLVIPCDGSDLQYVVAVDKHTGKTAWKTDRPPIDAQDGDMRKSFCTPLVIRVGDQDQLILPGAQWFVAYDPRSGQELWRINHGSGYSVVPRPVYDDGVVYLCNGFNKATLWAVRVDGRGDVTNTHVAWRAEKQIPLRPSPLLRDGVLYLISDNGVATALDAKSGKVHWTRRMPGNYSASPLSADGRIYFFSQEGKTTVLKPGTKYAPLAENHLDEGCFASAAALDDALYVRTIGHLYKLAK